jgi:hypothetical protein
MGSAGVRHSVILRVGRREDVNPEGVHPRQGVGFGDRRAPGDKFLIAWYLHLALATDCREVASAQKPGQATVGENNLRWVA